MPGFRSSRLITFVVASGLAVACGLGGSSDRDGEGPGLLDAGADARIVEGGLHGDARGAGGSDVQFNPLCGPGHCDGAPDDPDACVGFQFDGSVIRPPESEAGSGGSAAGGAGGGGGFGGTSGAGGTSDAGGTAGSGMAGGAPEPDAGRDSGADAAPLDASFAGDVSAPPAADDGGGPGALDAGSFDARPDSVIEVTTGAMTPPAPWMALADATSAYPEADAPVFACHVVLAGSGPEHRCDFAGRGAQGAACTSSRDCAPGLGCVGQERAGQCLPFCCRDPEACAAGTYCAERPLRLADGAASAPMVPVCAPADACRLDDPTSCSASSGTERSCAIVRPDGTTACIEPGDGKDGDACPCATGYFCSVSTNQCIKTCSTEAPGQCGDGRCQATANFPAGIGLCVGGAGR